MVQDMFRYIAKHPVHFLHHVRCGLVGEEVVGVAVANVYGGLRCYPTELIDCYLLWGLLGASSI
jgi:hypothetical protein